MSDIIISVNCLDLQFALFQPLRVFTFLFDRCLEFFLAEADGDESIICAYNESMLVMDHQFTVSQLTVLPLDVQPLCPPH